MLAGMRWTGNTSAWLVGMQTSITTMENSVEIPWRKKSGTTIWSSNPTTRYLPRWKEIICKRYLHTYVYRSTICNCKNVGPTQISISQWVDKETCVCVFVCVCVKEYYSAIKKEWINGIHSDLDEIGDYYSKWSNSGMENQMSNM